MHKNVVRWGHIDQIYWLLRKIIFQMQFCLWLPHRYESLPTAEGLLHAQLFPSDALLLSNGSVAVCHSAFIWSWVGVLLPCVKPGQKWARSGPWQMATPIWGIRTGTAVRHLLDSPEKAWKHQTPKSVCKTFLPKFICLLCVRSNSNFLNRNHFQGWVICLLRKHQFYYS